MTGKTHLSTGIASGVTVGLCAYGPSKEAMAFAFACVIGSLFPDIDHSGSKISKTLRPLAFIITMFCSHRGIFHTPLFYAIPALIIYIFFPNVADSWLAGFLMGIGIHLIQDMFNSQGVMIFYPIKKKINVAKIKSNTPVGLMQETAVSAFLFICIAAVVVAMFRMDELNKIMSYVAQISK